MSDESKLPSEQEFAGFVGKLREFRGTLDQNDQKMLDAMVGAAFKSEKQEGDVQGYWYAVVPGPYGPVPGFYVAPPPPPIYAYTPWGYTYARYW